MKIEDLNEAFKILTLYNISLCTIKKPKQVCAFTWTVCFHMSALEKKIKKKVNGSEFASLILKHEGHGFFILIDFYFNIIMHFVYWNAIEIFFFFYTIEMLCVNWVVAFAWIESCGGVGHQQGCCSCPLVFA